jgi:hypothetical protein
MSSNKEEALLGSFTLNTFIPLLTRELKIARTIGSEYFKNLDDFESYNNTLFSFKKTKTDEYNTK